MTREHCVYRFYATTGDLLYVGRTCRVGERFGAHRREKHWWPQVARIELDHCTSEADAIDAEHRYIRELLPQHNIADRLPERVAALLERQPVLRDRLALSLLLVYHVRREGLRLVRFRHFDDRARELVVEGEASRVVQIADGAFWADLERVVETQAAQPDHYFMASERTIPRAGRRVFPTVPMGRHGIHNWWHRCADRAPFPPSLIELGPPPSPGEVPARGGTA